MIDPLAAKVLDNERKRDGHRRPDSRRSLVEKREKIRERDRRRSAESKAARAAQPKQALAPWRSKGAQFQRIEDVPKIRLTLRPEDIYGRRPPE